MSGVRNTTRLDMNTLLWGAFYVYAPMFLMFFGWLFARLLLRIRPLSQMLQKLGKFRAEHHKEHFLTFVVVTVIWLACPFTLGALGALCSAVIFEVVSTWAKEEIAKENVEFYSSDCIWFNATASKAHFIISLVYGTLAFLLTGQV